MALCVLAAVVYGIVHNQVTARVCVEYFTIGHPPLFNTKDPAFLAIGWGIIASWWVGLMLGVPLAAVARVGIRPKRNAGSLVKPIACLLALMGSCSFVAGVIGWSLANRGIVFLVGPLSSSVPADRHVPFIADLWAHAASYIVGFVGGALIMVLVWRSRGRRGNGMTQ